jgi:hypothetical protein
MSVLADPPAPLPVAAPIAPPLPLSRPEMVRALAIAPLWVVSTGTWGVASALLLVWTTVRETPWVQR